MRQTAILYNAQQAHQCLLAIWQAIKPWLIAGHRFVVEIGPEPQTRSQQNLYHALIKEISQQAKHLGATWDEEDWKRLLIDKFAQDTGKPQGRIIPNLDGTGVVEVGLLSRHFDKQTASEFTEWIYGWGADNGITFKDTEQA